MLFLPYQARFKLALKPKEKHLHLTAPRFILSSENMSYVKLKFESSLATTEIGRKSKKKNCLTGFMLITRETICGATIA